MSRVAQLVRLLEGPLPAFPVRSWEREVLRTDPTWCEPRVYRDDPATPPPSWPGWRSKCDA